MSRHRLQLETRAKGPRRIPEARRSELMRGEIALGEALGVSTELAEGLRGQAVALYQAGKWARCAEVLVGLEGLGADAPQDAVFMLRCLTELGRDEEAELYLARAELWLGQLEAQLSEGATP